MKALSPEEISRRRSVVLMDSGVGALDRQLLESGKLQSTPALQHVQAFLASTETLLLLSGSVGQGKSVASAYAVQQVIASVPPHEVNGIAPARMPKFMSAVEMQRMSYFETGVAWQQLERAMILVIDDLGVEMQDPSGGFRAKLDEVINVRLQKRARTVLSTNLEAVQFAERYGQRISDRLRMPGISRVAEAFGRSLR